MKTLNLKQLLMSFLIVSSACCLANKQQPHFQSAPFSIGETISWHSSVLDEQRSINVYLPQSYHQGSNQDYPVIYLLDGSADEDFIHIAGLVQFGSFSWIKMLPESIVVGIANVDRKHDMTYPTQNEQDKKDFPTTGGSKQFIQFIKDELQPMVNLKYRTTTNKTIIGQSLGGLLATEILFNHPEMFDNYLIVSPSLWWDDGSLLNSKTEVYLSKQTVFIGVGKEGTIMEGAAKSLYEVLNKHPNKNLKFQFFEQLDHGDTLHLAVYAGFEFLFNQQNAAAVENK
ncbi:alpha/beta hydrolase [Marinicella litoralis]|uniref:Alpha/beta superfamily hydrolase n=1 Tax=Marinicella litoralis TaxID=644220 RepID=A0A4R6XLG3_9GAMM|nr:alpha/beta hydrolase-fold protein [Marinicella litoralis]TDR20455.1 hypothetical protein C8D91_1427 [Marinicella litoralis]